MENQKSSHHVVEEWCLSWKIINFLVLQDRSCLLLDNSVFCVSSVINLTSVLVVKQYLLQEGYRAATGIHRFNYKGIHALKLDLDRTGIVGTYLCFVIPSLSCCRRIWPLWAAWACWTPRELRWQPPWSCVVWQESGSSWSPVITRARPWPSAGASASSARTTTSRAWPSQAESSTTWRRLPSARPYSLPAALPESNHRTNPRLWSTCSRMTR